MDITRAGDRLVTVGERGFTLVSDDAGQSWRAVATPVTRSLTRVAFENDKLGVAVGPRRLDRPHRGRRRDLDGRRSRRGRRRFTARRHEPRRRTGSRPTVPSACISRPRTVAPPGSAARSSRRNSRITFRRCSPSNGVLWLVAEYGTLARSDDGGLTWIEVVSPYEGSFFGAVAARDGVLVIFGMRGNIFRSADGGVTWQKIETGTTHRLQRRHACCPTAASCWSATLAWSPRAPTTARRSRSSGRRPGAASRRSSKCRAAWSSPARAASGCSIPRRSASQ